MAVSRVYRIATEQDIGPFEITKHLSNEEAMRFFYGLPEAVDWLEIVEADILLQMLMGAPPKVWQPTDDHPHHVTDVPTRPDPDTIHRWRVGCKDLDQLHHWFPPESFPFLASYGFKLYVYECECEHIHFGTYQLLFCVDNLTTIEVKELV